MISVQDFGMIRHETQFFLKNPIKVSTFQFTILQKTLGIIKNMGPKVASGGRNLQEKVILEFRKWSKMGRNFHEEDGFRIFVLKMFLKKSQKIQRYRF